MKAACSLGDCRGLSFFATCLKCLKMKRRCSVPVYQGCDWKDKPGTLAELDGMPKHVWYVLMILLEARASCKARLSRKGKTKKITQAVKTLPTPVKEKRIPRAEHCASSPPREETKGQWRSRGLLAVRCA
eukprot:1160831-Pelagomonas_calceolata.AAC.4